MTPAQRTARGCTITAAVISGTAIYAGATNPLLALPGLLTAAIFASVAATYRADEARQRARREQSEAAAAADDQALLRPPDARAQLDTGCCERWWTSCGFDHDPTCPMSEHRSAA